MDEYSELQAANGRLLCTKSLLIISIGCDKSTIILWYETGRNSGSQVVLEVLTRTMSA